MSEISKSPSVDITFEDLNYVIKGGDKKKILKSINGTFYSNELTVILGASGSGKTTLLNILAGYTSSGVTGSIRINGMPRNMKTFHKLTAYIMQDNLLQPYLNVEELITIAADLKLGDRATLQEKSAAVNEVIRLLGLEKCLETRTEYLSGGEKRRLSIALEMVSNPPVIFIDEPTSGLDTTSAKQCINTLEKLKGQGRSVICTIHQPSASMLQQFDQVYFLHNGVCVYNGSTSNLIPFMSSLGYECPVTHTPADYIIETVATIEGAEAVLTEGIQNGKVNRRDFNTRSNSNNCFLKTGLLPFSEDVMEMNASQDFPTTFWTQFRILSSRMFLQIKRNRLALYLQIMHHILCSIFSGYTFYETGKDANKIFFAFNYLACCLVFFLYTYTMLPVIALPTEFQLLQREHFNRWYDLKPYFLAMSLRTLPLMIVFGLGFISVTYVLSGQPLESYRFAWFATAAILTGIVSEGLGQIIGSVCNVTHGFAITPFISGILILCCMYGAGYGTKMNPILNIVVHISYIRVGLIAVSNAVFEGRGRIDCLDDLYCHYHDPTRFLRDMGMQSTFYKSYVLGLVVYAVLFRITAFLVFRHRLTAETYQIIINYTTKVLRFR